MDSYFPFHVVFLFIRMRFRSCEKVNLCKYMYFFCYSSQKSESGKAEGIKLTDDTLPAKEDKVFCSLIVWDFVKMAIILLISTYENMFSALI